MASVVRRLCGWSFGALACVLLAGCGGGDDGGIKTYRVATPQERDKPRELPNGGDAPVPDGPPKVRFLGAVIPDGKDRSYFVRFSGPIEQIDAHEKDFDAFLNSIRVPGEGGKPVSWTVPAGWKEGPGNSARVVTIEKAGAPVLYISQPFGGDLLQNVNRWRLDPVGLREFTEAELPTVTREIALGATKAYRVDMRGPGLRGR